MYDQLPMLMPRSGRHLSEKLQRQKVLEKASLKNLWRRHYNPGLKMEKEKEKLYEHLPKWMRILDELVEEIRKEKEEGKKEGG